MSDDRANPWTTLDSRVVYDNPWVRLTHHEVLTPRQTPGIYGVIHFKNRAIGVLPIDAEGHTWLVGQYRFPLGLYSWEMPEGGGARDEPPLAAAQRELREETGYTAGQWRELLQLHLSNSVTDEHAVCFLAWDLTPGPAQPEETEQLALRRLPFREVAALVWRGEITDVMTVAAVQRLELLLRRGEAPPALAAAIGALD